MTAEENGAQQRAQSTAVVTKGLPPCFDVRDEGIFVDPAPPLLEATFKQSVDTVFVAGLVFRGLDYSLFQQLLYDLDRLRDAGPLRLADCAETFPAERRRYYQQVRVIDGNAEYLFEPIQIEKEIDGNVVTEKVDLDFDEFVAVMWLQNVRYGIDVPKVQAALHSLATERMLVAYELPPMPGEDARVEEESQELRRSNAPRMRSDGKVDLAQYANRFPQVQEGAVLLRKIPLRFGTPGRSIQGDMLAAIAPKDVDLAAFSGEGTRIDRDGGQEILVSTIHGFLSVDASRRISVTEKIVNREGVSTRTTGDLVLEGDEYEEFGEVQEGRSIQGKHLTFHADVCGRVMSTGGNILIEQNLVGGAALNRDGLITIKGRVSAAHVQVASGLINISRAENSVVVGQGIEIETAIGCTILGDDVVIKEAFGCVIAGKRIVLESTGVHSGTDTLILMLLPDFELFDHRRAQEESHRQECAALSEKLKAAVAEMAAQPDFQQYLSVAGRLQRKELVFTSAQEEKWNQFKQRVGPIVKRAGKAREDIKALEDEIALCDENLAQIEAERQAAASEQRCTIKAVKGDTQVRAHVLRADGPVFARLPPKELTQTLRHPGLGNEILFSNDVGSFDWKSR